MAKIDVPKRDFQRQSRCEVTHGHCQHEVHACAQIIHIAQRKPKYELVGINLVGLKKKNLQGFSFYLAENEVEYRMKIKCLKKGKVKLRCHHEHCRKNF